MNKVPTQYLSFTGYKTMRDCPESYYRKYVLRQAPPMEDQRNFLKGNACHNLMEAYIIKSKKSGEWTPESAVWMAENAEQYWAAEIEKVRNSKRGQFIEWRSSTDEQDQKDMFLKWAGNLSEIFLKHKLNPKFMLPEFKADSKATAGGHLFTMGGRIDILMGTPKKELIVLDLKASSNAQVKDLDQLVWYSVLTEIKLGRKIDYAGYILPAFTKTDIRRIPQEAKDTLMQRVGQALQDIKDKKFSPRPEKSLCFFCPVKFACSEFGGAVENKNGIVSLDGLL